MANKEVIYSRKAGIIRILHNASSCQKKSYENHLPKAL